MTTQTEQKRLILSISQILDTQLHKERGFLRLWLWITVADLIESDGELPQPSDINSLSLIDNDPFKDDEDFVSTYDLDKSFISMVSVDVSEYLGSQEPIKKTLTIPKWADKLGREMGLNFSQTLTDAIADKKVQA